HLPAVYEISEGGLLSTLTGSDSIVGSTGEPLPSFNDMALEWYDDVDNLDRWVVADGPDEWPRIESIEGRPDVAVAVSGEVTDIAVENHRISFTTDAIGVPHLVKVSYFPNWTADGADGPWRATPSLMVVVPTAEDVVLTFEDTWAETGGFILSIAGVVALLVVGLAMRRNDSDS
ncbi:MAG: hypothetical protein O6951_11505, partial [Actinobacteria bacterium]|nr:hypothetical protein [Actinomycetota bacterium]